jgi:serine-type D-Ala-D-Ala carboxypeptidase/endopeptidase (penicillin-binding protein 4)
MNRSVQSGTLKNRFVGTTAQGIVQAKTGSMTGVNSLSGYVENAQVPTIFSIITNFSSQSSSVVRQGIDNIVVLLSQLTPN